MCVIKHFDDLASFAKNAKNRVLAVAAAQDADVLQGVEFARKQGVAYAILVGDADKIKSIAAHHGIDLKNYEILHETDNQQGCEKAAALIAEGRAHIFMKGLVDTAVALKALLNKEYRLRTDRLLSHVSIFKMAQYDRLIFVTDPAINPAPDLEQKRQIIENAVALAQVFGVPRPYVAPVCAVEKPNPKMQASVHAEALSEMNKSDEIKGCFVSGTVSLDVALEPGAAKQKGYAGEIGGKADILLAPNIEAGNILHKSIVYFGGGQMAGVTMGLKCPVVMTSRADSKYAKLYSIAAAAVISEQGA